MDARKLNSIEDGSNDQINKKKSYLNDEKSEDKKKILNENLNETSNGLNTSGVGNIGTDVILPDSVLDKLYHTYSIKQRRDGLIWFLVASILFDLWSLLIPQGFCWKSEGIFALNALLNAVLILVLHFTPPTGDEKKYSNIIWKIAPHLSLVFAFIQLILYLYTKTVATPRDILGWAILLMFLIYVTIPVPLIYTGIIIGSGFFIIYLSCLIGFTNRDPYFIEQIGANIILIIAAAIIGILYYFLGEAKQKRAFLETKKSLEVKMIIEEQSAEQERLLLSVLPEHVAVKMRQDLGSTNSEQFKKIYMSRHENVSILYADIVGFTAISSTYSAQDLVKMLNELFARFDRLAEKYHQLRIKILGDCYYCISGAPVERPDHAVLCVHMGLSMVKAIKYVQQKTNSPVDMRVGIHTGAILAGILGQRQWQFDVYSKDVELANKMESSGKAGFVHISEKTLSFLNGEFEIEPALGERREEALRIAGLKTYFIVKVLKPFVSLDQQKKNGTSSTDDAHRDSNASKQSDNQRNEDSTEINVTEILPDDESKANSDDAQEKQEDFKQRLRKELVAREGHGDLSKDTTIFLNFKNEELEKAYTSHREPYSSVPLIATLLVQIVDIFYSFLILPRLFLHFALLVAPLILILFLVLISVAESFPQTFPKFYVHLSKKFNDISIIRRLTAIFIVCSLGFTNLFDMYLFSCLSSTKTDNIDFNYNSTIYGQNNISNNNYMNNSMLFNNINTISNYSNLNLNRTVISLVLNMSESSELLQETLIYPSYLSNYSVLILIAIAVISQLTHFCKIILMLVFTVLHCAANIHILHNGYLYEHHLVSYTGLPIKITASTILFVVALSLSFLARHMDKEDRIIFKWKTEVAEQKEKVSDMRRRNEALVYNILPVHVAEHFMKNRKRSHDDLYSQSYAEVGVLFASMPNFTDFYSEETVNNQGLECLRFLNEVISDYDALLELPQFQDIIKIKTIGSTYMAASGLNPSRQVKPTDTIIVRWAHLALLVEFALELKKALTGINEQSFNHFVLKMGINHGPITAGVIGARKPHYDIWGNTVNVASRMESTGKAGAIQVTEETTQILKQFGYTFEQRGLVAVKGKGQLMTYYLSGKEVKPISPVSPQSNDAEKIGLSQNNENKSKLSNENATNINNASNKSKDILILSEIKGSDKNTTECVSRSPKSLCSPVNSPSSFILHEKGKTSKNDKHYFVDENGLTDNLNSIELNDKTKNGIDNCVDLDVDVVDVKTPLLDLNSTNLETNIEFINNDTEKDSLILKQ